MIQEPSGKVSAGLNVPGGRGRNSICFGVIAVSLAVAAGAWHFHRQRAATMDNAGSPTGSAPANTRENGTATPLAEPDQGSVAIHPRPTPTLAAHEPPVARQVLSPEPSPIPLRAEPSAYTRTLMGNLLSVDPSHGAITPERAQFWKQEYDKLVKEGAGAVPAIREFLEKNVDVNFKSAEGGDAVGAESMRLAMFEALRQIGGAEAAGVAAQAMQTTLSPKEVAILAGALDAMAPEQYRDAAVAAARAGLLRAAQEPALADTSPLFEVLQKFGGANALGDLEQAASRWNYYAPLVLASLPEGAGIPSLARMAQNADGTFASSSRFALRMLAELAPQYPDAAQALFEQVNNNRVPDSAWLALALALGGEQTYYGNGYLNAAITPGNATDLKTYHISSNEQNYRSFNVAGNWTPEQIQQQLALVEQIMAANPAAARMMEGTRSALLARLGR